MVTVKTLCNKIDFVVKFIAELTAYFFVIMLDLIFTLLIEIKIFEIPYLEKNFAFECR